MVFVIVSYGFCYRLRQRGGRAIFGSRVQRGCRCRVRQSALRGLSYIIWYLLSSLPKRGRAIFGNRVQRGCRCRVRQCTLRGLSKFIWYLLSSLSRGGVRHFVTESGLDFKSVEMPMSSRHFGFSRWGTHFVFVPGGCGLGG